MYAGYSCQRLSHASCTRADPEGTARGRGLDREGGSRSRDAEGVEFRGAEGIEVRGANGAEPRRRRRCGWQGWGEGFDYMVWGSVVSSPSGVWGVAPAEN